MTGQKETPQKKGEHVIPLACGAECPTFFLGPTDYVAGHGIDFKTQSALFPGLKSWEVWCLQPLVLQEPLQNWCQPLSPVQGGKHSRVHCVVVLLCLLSHRISGEILVQTGRGEGKEEKAKWMGSVPQNSKTDSEVLKHNLGSNNQSGKNFSKEMPHTWKICCEMAVEQHLECIRIAAFKKFSNPFQPRTLSLAHVTWLLAPRTTAYLLPFL